MEAARRVLRRLLLFAASDESKPIGRLDLIDGQRSAANIW